MHDTILEILAKRAPKKREGDEAGLDREIRKALARISARQHGSKAKKSNRGGLSSMGARGVVVKEGDIFSRRVVVKASYISSSDKNARARIGYHLNYVGRNKVEDERKSPELYDQDDKAADLKNKLKDFAEAPQIFNIIISPEDGGKVDLKEFTRDFIKTVENDLGTKVSWVAGNHYDTKDPHVHLLIKGMDDAGQALYLKRDYIARGLRARASQVMTQKLGVRSLDEVVKSLSQEVTRTKKTALDDLILENARDGRFETTSIKDIPQSLVEKRLEFLASKDLVYRFSAQTWQISAELEKELKNLARTTSLIEKLSDGMRFDKQACIVIDPQKVADCEIKGHVVERGYVGDFGGKEYLLVKSKEKKFVYVELEKYSEKVPAQTGEFVRIEATKTFSGPLATDHSIDKFAQVHGIYDATVHAQRSENSIALPPGVSSAEYAQIHVNRLEVLARKGLVQKQSEGKFSIPKDYLDKITAEAKKSRSGYQPHIKVVRLSPARLKSASLAQGLSR